jgi:hypothetical protein
MADLLKRDVDAAIKWGRDQITNPTQDWTGMCQSFVRQCDGVEAWASSAINAWNSIPDSEKVAGGSPFDAPRGAAIYFAGGSYGHVALCIGKTTSDKCLSNDYVRTGKIDEAPRDFPRWGLTYKGWSFFTPFGELRPGSSELWDGEVPPKENVDLAEDDRSVKNKAAWRLACRLYDLKAYSGTPQPCYSQGYPEKAVVAYQKMLGWEGSGKYGESTHRAIWPV